MNSSDPPTPQEGRGGAGGPGMSPAPGQRRRGLVTGRQEEIVARVHSKGFVSIEALSRQFRVTPQTIRRDINFLARKGIVRRYHGGAGMATSVENMAYTDRQILCLREKQAIARLVARHIPDKASLFINIGTTTEAVAKAIRGHERLRVITNNLNVASILSGNENFEVIVTGGVVRSRDRGIIGEATIDFIGQFKVDFGIIGISGIDYDGTLLDFDYREVRAARAIIDNSRRVYLVADHTKFGRNAMVRLGSIAEVHGLFTDRHPPAPLQKVIEAEGIRLFVAGRREVGGGEGRDAEVFSKSNI
jgi:DeoR family glycerol-3-phosphate regulon repressor